MQLPGESAPSLQPPPGQDRFPALSGLRGVAVLGVMLCHASALQWETTWWGPFTYLAGSTVFIFFALSGFLLYRPFVSRRSKGVPAPPLGTFFRRRLLRIVPAYWAALTICALLLGYQVFNENWWVYYGFLQIYELRWQGLGGLPHVWTLCIEMSFYVFLPVFAWVAGRYVARRSGSWVRAELTAVVALIALSLTARAIGTLGWLPWLTFGLLPGLIDFFAIGMLFAVLSVALDRGAVPEHWQRRLRRAVAPAWLLAAGCFVTSALVWGPSSGSSWMIPLEGRNHADAVAIGIELGHRLLLMTLATSLILPALLSTRRGPLVRLLSSRPLVAAGAVSYAIYLWHWPLMRWWSDQAREAGIVVLGNTTLTVLSVGLPITLLAASISYRVVELPFLKRKEAERPAPARSPQPAQPAPAPQPEPATSSA